MSQVSTEDPQALVGQPALDVQGRHIGEIQGIYLQNGTRQPEWAAVALDTGEVTLAPVIGATPTDDGLWLPISSDRVAGAPARFAELPRRISDEQAGALYRYYSGASGTRRSRSNGSSRSTGANGSGTARRRPARAADRGREVSGRAADEGRRVASSAVEQGSQVASTAAEEGQRVASTAVQEGREVARTAASQATELAETARQQVSQVGEELTTQARTLVRDTRSGLQDQVEAQTRRLADTLRQLGAEARALADGQPDRSGVLADYVSQAAEKLNEVAKEVEARGPEGLVDDLKGLAQTRPGTFVLGAAVAGFGIGRLLRSAGDDEQAADPTRRVATRGGSR